MGVKRAIASAVWAVAIPAALVAVPQAAYAQTYPGGDGGGILVTWGGTYESANYMDHISVTLCDGDPRNTNEAVAYFRVNMVDGTSRLAPTEMRVRQFEKSCKLYGNMRIGYAEFIKSVQIVFWGSTKPGNKYYTKPANNPFGCGGC
ncbi:hypothetical protein SAMN05421504_11146 [Amycolatopsis xylanica]|uniref:Uncharacterized protein n=1 Tax=Amycolatopsis xylanica TaxID=589385 RepID=A0A1H3REU4_9PSEU|nr:hypothetical protein [Amycolatopsis xylanica]SDZ24156.1 hypothetical protein SAMN05421504_11146 [Amycolatopsis xylanica]